ncbi:actin-like ATPase domain-containing protein [Aureobasidium pullulans]|nr:actin-like ATPase domain-containing protein [Aureobasidium pullulans]
MSAKRSIILSVDLGTTHSGAAYAFRGDRNPFSNIQVIRNWVHGDRGEKVPTKIRYINASTEPARPRGTKRLASGEHVHDQHVQDTYRAAWGYEAGDGPDMVQYVKYLFGPPAEIPEGILWDDITTLLEKFGKTPRDAVVDYLIKLREHIYKVVLDEFGPEFMATTEIEWILTVPAIWSDDARYATLMAAESAGIGKTVDRSNDTITMITEPEAAAHFAYNLMEMRNINVGDIAIVCDVGGGTIDLITFEITSLEPLRLKECVGGTGGLCGSALLNAGFQEHVERCMGGKENFKDFTKRVPYAWPICMKEFENSTKKYFHPDNGAVSILFPGIDIAGMEPNYILLTPEDLQRIFERVINPTVDLVQDQYDAIRQMGKYPRGIILVGGFGQNDYLKEVLENKFESADPEHPCEVTRPLGGWSAVSQGAVIHALTNDTLVQSRIARHHYGVLVRQPYNKKIHTEKYVVTDEFDGKNWVDNQIEWHIHTGQTITAGSPIKINQYLVSESKNLLVSESATIIVSDEVEAPKEFNSTDLTRILCTIESSLENVEREDWKTYRRKGEKKHSALHHTIEMSLDSELSFQFCIGDRVLGKTTVAYE